MQACEIYVDYSLVIAHKHVISPQINECALRCISIAGLAVFRSSSYRLVEGFPICNLPSPAVTGPCVCTLRCLLFRRGVCVLEQAAEMFVVSFCVCSMNASLPSLAKALMCTLRACSWEGPWDFSSCRYPAD